MKDTLITVIGTLIFFAMLCAVIWLYMNLGTVLL